MQHQIPVHDAPTPRKAIQAWEPDWLKRKAFDLAVVVSFGYFLPRHILNHFSLGALNVHPSLLPLYRGSAPIQHAIINGDRETGISIIDLDQSRFDAGRILKQSRFQIPNHEHIRYQELHDFLALKGGEDLVDVIQNLEYYQVTFYYRILFHD